MTIADEPPALAGQPAYGGLSRRPCAIAIDAIVMMLVIAGALMVTAALRSDTLTRMLGFALAAGLLLYDLLLVAPAGGIVLGWRAGLCDRRRRPVST
jgi:hypothetical protein